VFDRVTIAYRGAGYEIGRGPDFYGIWTVGALRSQPLERWPETQEGWSAAWARFTEIEAPGTIAPAGRRVARLDQQVATASQRSGVAGAGTGAIGAVLLLVVGVVLGIAGLFPAYLGGESLAQQPDNLVAHVIYLAAWSASAALIPLGGTRRRMAALLGIGTSIVTFGLFLADLGTAIAGGAHAGSGLVLSLLGWLACAAGSAVAFLLRPVDATGRLFTLGRPRGSDVGPVVMLVLAGLAAAAAFAPAWDSFTLRTSSGQTQSLTLGNAFTNPGLVIAADVAVMVAFAAAVIAAAFWRPMRHGAVLLAGAIIPMAAQAISALVQVGEPTSPAQFGISSAQASQLGLTISSGLTPAFWIYCVFLVALGVSCAWMFFTRHEEPGPLRARAGTDAGPDAEAEVWHVARTDTFDMTGVRSPARGDESDDDDFDDDDFDDEFGDDDFDDDFDGHDEFDRDMVDRDKVDRDEFDNYEEFESDDPSDSAVTPGVSAAPTRSGTAPATSPSAEAD
jgi:hypothetical protein